MDLNIKMEHIQVLYIAATGRQPSECPDWPRFCDIAKGVLAVCQRDAINELRSAIQLPIASEYVAKPFCDGFGEAQRQMFAAMGAVTMETFRVESRGRDAASKPPKE